MRNKKFYESLKESDRVEFKVSVSEWKELVETVCAFANTGGGEIYIGVSNSGKIIGVDIGKDTIEDLTNKIINNTEPKIYPEIKIERFNRKSIIVVDVKRSSDQLVLAFGRPYKRVGKSTVRMSKDEYEKRILEKHKEELRFDINICESAGLSEIDILKLKDFLKSAKSD